LPSRPIAAAGRRSDAGQSELVATLFSSATIDAYAPPPAIFAFMREAA
jgi:hypothetical protein